MKKELIRAELLKDPAKLQQFFSSATPSVFKTAFKQTVVSFAIIAIVSRWWRSKVKRDVERVETQGHEPETSAPMIHPVTLTREEVKKLGEEEAWVLGQNPYIFRGFRFFRKYRYFIDKLSKMKKAKENVFYLKARENCSRLVHCACSCGEVHNETVNIWSHYFAALYFWNAYKKHDNDIVQYHALAAASLFSISTVAHTFMSHGKTTECNLFRFDRASIAAYFCVMTLIAGHHHFGYRKERLALKIFTPFAFASGTGSVLALYFGDKWQPWVKALILSVQISCAFLVAVRESVVTNSELRKRLVAFYLPASTTFALAGALVFSMHIPEKYCKLLGLKPGYFDLFGQSHNLMHIFVAFSAYFGYRGQSLWQKMIDYNL